MDRNEIINTMVGYAGCYSPDSGTSAGAEFLVSVYDAITESWDNGDVASAKYESDLISELADSAVPNHNTHSLMSAYVDLGLYQDDENESGATDIVGQATWALYDVAGTMMHAWVADKRENEGSDDE